MVHGNLTTDNILLKEKDAVQDFKIIDFGTAEMMEANGKNLPVNSINFRAPETFKKTFTEKSDIWSIGILTYFLLMGKTPFSGKNEKEIQQNIKAGNV